MVQPDLFIIGAPKCATTSLYGWLKAHPEACSSNLKEPFYLIDPGDSSFKKESNYHHHGLDGYQEYFTLCDRPRHKVVFESTPVYIYQKTALDVISAFKPLPKIIICMRRPSERVYSVFNHAKYMLGHIGEDVSFREFVDLTAPEGFASNINNRRATGEIRLDVEKLPERFRFAIENSIYINHISKWLDLFGESNLKSYLVEDIRDDPAQVLKDISAFVGIDETFWDDFSFMVRNKTVIYKSEFIQKKVVIRLTRILQRMGLDWPQAIRNAYTHLNVKEIQPRSEEDECALKELDNFFEPYNKKLTERIGIDISAWF